MHTRSNIEQLPYGTWNTGGSACPIWSGRPRGSIYLTIEVSTTCEITRNGKL